MTDHPTMSATRWARVQEIFTLALDREGSDREAYVVSACGDDEALRREVLSLLEAHEYGELLDLPDAGLPTSYGPQRLAELAESVSDRYVMEHPLGTGGMATVYLARDVRHGRKVAIKVLLPEFAATVGADRFLQEIRIAAGLRHPHILPLYDSGEEDGLLFYVMPVEGESLRNRLSREEIIPVDDSLQITREVLGALGYAHGEGVIHRDIKPGNILLSQGHAIIADFGIARAVGMARGERLTQAGRMLGTPAYMSPEQLMGDLLVDGRADLYAVACMLYEMLTGAPPLVGHGVDSLDSEVAPNPIPPGVEAAIRRALAPEREDRFASAAEFIDHLTSPASRDTATPPAARPRRQSIAVMPFTNMSADPENEYFSDGMTEEVINALAQIGGLHVAARRSSFAFKGRTLDVADVGTKLKVATVLEGSVRKAGNRLRITVQLVNVADGYHLWSERFDREMDDVFAIQDEIARAIVEQLKVRLSIGSGALVKPPTDNLEAYQQYLKGRHLWNRRSKSEMEQAIEYLQGAIELDPGFAAAYAGLADAYLVLGSYAYAPRTESFAKAKAAIERALELDETAAEAHASLGQILRAEWDWAREEVEYRRAIELNPQYATAHQWYATHLSALGRWDEALHEIRLAQDLDPLSHAISVTVAIVLFLAGQYDEAEAQLQRTLTLEPNFASTHAWFGAVYAEMGRYDEVEVAVNRAVELAADNPNVFVGLGYAYARQGRREEALEIARQAEARGGCGWVAMIFGELGDLDRAFEAIERALREGETWNSLFFLKVYPWFRSLRNDPRYHELLRRLNFPVTS